MNMVDREEGSGLRPGHVCPEPLFTTSSPFPLPLGQPFGQPSQLFGRSPGTAAAAKTKKHFPAHGARILAAARTLRLQRRDLLHLAVQPFRFMPPKLSSCLAPRTAFPVVPGQPMALPGLK
jgi:hypothetical protein